MPGPPAYRYAILQEGSLPLAHDGVIDTAREHRCTSALVWRADAPPSPANGLVTDPCFTAQGYEQAARVLHDLGVTLVDLGRAFITHGHHDHLPRVPTRRLRAEFQEVQP